MLNMMNTTPLNTQYQFMVVAVPTNPINPIQFLPNFTPIQPLHLISSIQHIQSINNNQSKQFTFNKNIQTIPSFIRNINQVGHTAYEHNHNVHDNCGHIQQNRQSMSNNHCHKSNHNIKPLLYHAKNQKNNSSQNLRTICPQRIQTKPSKQSKQSKKSVFECPICHKHFTRKSNLKQHLKIHSNTCDFICPVCCRGFKQKHSMIDHIRTHTGERPFICQYCPKAFKVKHNLSTHTRLHTGERPYFCTMCTKRFVSKSSLNAHVKSKHSNAK